MKKSRFTLFTNPITYGRNSAKIFSQETINTFYFIKKSINYQWISVSSS